MPGNHSGGYAAWLNAVRRKIAQDQKLRTRPSERARVQWAKRKRIEADLEGNRPTPERLARAGNHVSRFVGKDVNDDRSDAPRMDDADMLDKLRDKFEKPQYDAGKKLYNHFYLAGISQERARSLKQERVDCEGGTGHETESQLHHRQKFNEAIKALPFGVSAIVLAVVIEGRPLEQAGGFTKYKGRQQKITAAMTCLDTGLTMLAEHFRLVARRRRRYIFTADGYQAEVREDLWEKSEEAAS